MPRTPGSDPRTVARDIPGVLDTIVPQLTPGVVAHLNRSATSVDIKHVSRELVDDCSLAHAMLFELGVAVGESLLTTAPPTWAWDECLEKAVRRQRGHFDARIPEGLTAADKRVAAHVGHNLAIMLRQLSDQRRCEIVVAPPIPGYQWIANGHADFSISSTLIEVKCTARNFGAADYRQLIMYWLLSYCASLEAGGQEWIEGILLNPRSATCVAVNFNELLEVVSAGRNKIEIVQTFASMVASRHERP